MSAIADDTPTDPCPLSEGDAFLEGDSRLTILAIFESDERWFVRVESEHPRLGLARYVMSRADARRRVRAGRWSRLDC